MKSELFLEEKKKAAAALPGEVVRFIEECGGRPNPNSHLISVLHKVQDHVGYLGKEHMDAVSVLMQIPAAKSRSRIALAGGVIPLVAGNTC